MSLSMLRFLIFNVFIESEMESVTRLPRQRAAEADR